MRKIIFICVYLSSVLLANDNNIAGKIGSLGFGLETSSKINEKTKLRYNINSYNKDTTATKSGIDYTIDLELKSAGIIFDYYPINNNFKLSAGLYYNGNEIKIHTDTISQEIGDNTYTASLNGLIDFKPIAPYLGIGYDKTLTHKLIFNAEFGALFHGKPKVKLNGSITGNSAFDADLKKEESQLQDSLDKFYIYPVISLGLLYKF
jgi:hypothetical protein